MRPHERLEQEWAAFTGRPNMAVCSSGTAALHLALECLRAQYNWPDGAEVLVPDYSMVSAARAVVLAGLTPVFIDCGPDLLVDCSLLDHAYDYLRVLSEDGEYHVVAVLPVHVYGRRCDMETIYSFSKPRGIVVVEDCCEFQGGRHGELSDAWCWSFQSSKIVAGEEGGAVAFREPGNVTRAKSMRDCGFNEGRDYVHTPRGHNYRLADKLAEPVLESLQAHQIGNIDATGLTGTTREHRRRIEGWYDSSCPTEWRQPPRECVWVYDVRIPGLSREKQTAVVRALRGEGIKAGYGFWPLSKQEEFKQNRLVANLGYIKSDASAREIITLPVCPGITAEADCTRAFVVIKGSL
jgi:perosamine synthetase